MENLRNHTWQISTESIISSSVSEKKSEEAFISMEWMNTLSSEKN